MNSLFKKSILLASAAFLLVMPHLAFAQGGADSLLVPEERYARAVIEEVTEQSSDYGEGFIERVYTAEISAGTRKGERITIEQVVDTSDEAAVTYRAHDSVIVLFTQDSEGAETFYIVDYYRLPALLIVLLVFIAIALLVARKAAARALIGLAVSLVVLLQFIVPQLVTTSYPLLVGGGGAIAIAALTLFIAHGWNRKTQIAAQGMFATIIFTVIASQIAVSFAQLFGRGSEEAYFLQIALGSGIELRGLLLAGFIIGALGVLDDVATALAATVEEIHSANPKLSGRELYAKGLRVGRTHIASLINTLVLAYAGAGLPLLLLFTLGQQPWWVTMNNQFFAEEIVRTLVGSASLVIAVPITTAIAAWNYARVRETHPIKKVVK